MKQLIATVMVRIVLRTEVVYNNIHTILQLSNITSVNVIATAASQDAFANGMRKSVQRDKCWDGHNNR